MQHGLKFSALVGHPRENIVGRAVDYPDELLDLVAPQGVLHGLDDRLRAALPFYYRAVLLEQSHRAGANHPKAENPDVNGVFQCKTQSLPRRHEATKNVKFSFPQISQISQI